MHGGDIYRNSIQFDFSVNLNPLGVPPEVQWVLTEAGLHANKYPDLLHERLLAETSKIFSAPNDTIVYGNGASEIIMAICHGINPSKVMLTAPSFLGYSNCIKSALPKCKIIYNNLLEENDFAVYHNIIEQIVVEKPKLLFLTNPNNPNGLLVDKDLMEDIVNTCEKCGTILVVDECFLPLTGLDRQLSLAYSMKHRKSLIVLRAFTKTFAIPGVRVGYAICSKPSIAEAIRNHLPEWNISIFGQMAAAECLKHLEYVDEAAKIINDERKFLTDKLSGLGFKAYPSDANFILFKAKSEDLHLRLLEYSILIRDCSDYDGLGHGFYRIAIKLHNENEGLLSALGDLN